VLNGFVGAVVGGFEFAGWLVSGVGAMVKAAVGPPRETDRLSAALIKMVSRPARPTRKTRVGLLARFSHTGSDFRAAAAGRITEGLKEQGL
jgi:hypothetical protein